MKDYIKWLEDNSCDLCCESHNNGIDYDISWSVFGHYMSKPKRRELGYGTTPKKAIINAKQRIDELGVYGIKNKRL